MKKFEQVSSDDHWMSAAGRIKCLIFFGRIRGQGQGRGITGLMLRGLGPGEGVLYSEVQCNMSNGHMGTPAEQNVRHL